MITKLLLQDPANLATPLLAVFAADLAADTQAPVLLTASSAIAKAAATALKSGDFKAAPFETLLLHAPAGLKADRLLLVGVGKLATLSVDDLRKAAGVAVRFAKPRDIRDLAILFPDYHSVSDEPLDTLPAQPTSRAIVEGAFVADFEPDTYRSDRKDQSTRSVSLVANINPKSSEAENLRRGLDEGSILGSSQNFARSLVNEPGNILTPLELGHRAKAELEPLGIATEVYSTKKLKELKMGAFWAVSQGSEQPPALIVMTYTPKRAATKEVLGLVGKGITFDTGGISIKPADGMEKMKTDMSGAAAMIGAMRAIALLKPAVKVVSVVCSAENMPDGKAYRPGDILTAMSGKTIEVLNTDAEGRLVLADGLHYAKQLGATRLIDAATLTGACVVALGLINSGLFSNNNAACEQFQRAAISSGESFWRLPCTDDYRDQIKSHIGDITNTGNSRYGGAITAAMFLKEFVGDTPWLHLDIAGSAWQDDTKPWSAKGPTGVAVRSITEWVRSFAP